MRTHAQHGVQGTEWITDAVGIPVMGVSQNFFSYFQMQRNIGQVVEGRNLKKKRQNKDSMSDV